jgi:hypothetical protein
MQGEVVPLLAANGIVSKRTYSGLTVAEREFVFTDEEPTRTGAHAIADRIGQDVSADKLLATTVSQLAGRGFALRAAPTRNGVALVDDHRVIAVVHLSRMVFPQKGAPVHGPFLVDGDDWDAARNALAETPGPNIGARCCGSP